MQRFIKKASTDQTIDVFIQDSSSLTGAGLTGLAFNTSSLVCYYRRGAVASATALTLATQTVGGAHSDGGFVEISSANMPGWYRLDLSDAMVATGVPWVGITLKGAANMVPCNVVIAMEPVPADVVNVNGGTATALSTIDGISLESFYEIILAALTGKATYSSGTITFYKQDGSTVKYSLVASETNGSRAAGATIS